MNSFLKGDKILDFWYLMDNLSLIYKIMLIFKKVKEIVKEDIFNLF